MKKELHVTKDPADQPDLNRRQLGVGVLAVIGGTLGVVNIAQAFPRGSTGHFNAASRILARYGVSVNGGFDTTVEPGHDVLTTEIVVQEGTEYRQLVAMRNRLGEIIPCIKTAVFEDDATFTHFHPGEIVPCVRTAIEGHARAIHELFDSDQGGIVPCFRVASEMLEGGHIGTIEATHFHPGEIVPCVRTTIEGHARAIHELFDASEGGVIPCVKVVSEMRDGGRLGAIEVSVNDPNENFTVRVGGNTYKLDNGRLVLVEPGPR